jgi:membrane protein required for colicin V production
MQAYDLIMLAVLATATFFGLRKGLAWQIAYLASIFASYLVAYQFRGVAASMIDAEPPWNTFLGMLVLYLGCSLGIWLAFRFVSDIINRVRIKEFDRQAGALLGFGRGVLRCVIVTFFALTLLGEPQQKAIVESQSGYYIALLLDRADAIMPEELHGVLSPYLNTLDQKLGTRQTPPPEHPQLESWLPGNAPETAWKPAAINGQTNGQPSSGGEDAIDSWLRKRAAGTYGSGNP